MFGEGVGGVVGMCGDVVIVSLFKFFVIQDGGLLWVDYLRCFILLLMLVGLKVELMFWFDGIEVSVCYDCLGCWSVWVILLLVFKQGLWGCFVFGNVLVMLVEFDFQGEYVCIDMVFSYCQLMCVMVGMVQWMVCGLLVICCCEYYWEMVKGFVGYVGLWLLFFELFDGCVLYVFLLWVD